MSKTLALPRTIHQPSPSNFRRLSILDHGSVYQYGMETVVEDTDWNDGFEGLEGYAFVPVVVMGGFGREGNTGFSGDFG